MTTSHILMVRPVNFGYNEETALSNEFQQEPGGMPAADIARKAQAEFDGFVKILRKNGIHVYVVEDMPQPFTPDSIFPNNWISFHGDGQVFLYPMMAESRRLERREDVPDMLIEKGFRINSVTDLSEWELQGEYLEGTGSMVLDRDQRVAYACLSPRTHPEALDRYCRLTGYRKVVFHASGSRGVPVYHTNVMMCLGNKLAVICLESIPDPDERKRVEASLSAGSKEIVPINLEQLEHFAGNMLELSGGGEPVMVMSTQAYRSLRPEQIRQIERHCRLLHAPLDTIETYGGGSARCMIAEIFLENRS